MDNPNVVLELERDGSGRIVKFSYKERLDFPEGRYCTDCKGEVAVKLEDCPRYKEALRRWNED